MGKPALERLLEFVRREFDATFAATDLMEQETFDDASIELQQRLKGVADKMLTSEFPKVYAAALAEVLTLAAVVDRLEEMRDARANAIATMYRAEAHDYDSAVAGMMLIYNASIFTAVRFAVAADAVITNRLPEMPQVPKEDLVALGNGRSLKLFVALFGGRPVPYDVLAKQCWDGEAPTDDAIGKALRRMAEKIISRPYLVSTGDPASISFRPRNGQ